MEGKRIYGRRKKELFPLMTRPSAYSRGIYVEDGYIRELKIIKGGPYKDSRKDGVIHFRFPKKSKRARDSTVRNIRDGVPVRILFGIRPRRDAPGEDYDLGLHFVVSADEKEMTLLSKTLYDATVSVTDFSDTDMSHPFVGSVCDVTGFGFEITTKSRRSFAAGKSSPRTGTK
jgi:hypothetical protein